MIFTLAGTVTHKGDHFAVVEAFGVGYQVHMHKAALADLKIGQEVRFWTHEHLREDARDLFGFAAQGEHRLFVRLIAISGVGPKMAMNMLSLGSVKDIEAMIEKADVDGLTRVPGVGKKTAQKIVLELKGKLALDDEGGDGEVVAALVNLGYARERARDAVAATETGAVEERLRSALRKLGRG